MNYSKKYLGNIKFIKFLSMQQMQDYMGAITRLIHGIKRCQCINENECLDIGSCTL